MVDLYRVLTVRWFDARVPLILDGTDAQGPQDEGRWLGRGPRGQDHAEKTTKRGIPIMSRFFSRRPEPVWFFGLSAVMVLSLLLPLRAETLRGPGGLPPGLLAAMLGRMKG